MSDFKETEGEVVAVLPQAQTETTLAEEKIEAEAVKIETEAKSIKIASDEDYKRAAEYIRYIKQKSAEITDYFAPMKKAAYEAHKLITGKEKAALAPLVEAEKLLRDGMGAYYMEQEKKRQEEEARLRKLADEEAVKTLAEVEELEKQGKKEEAEALLQTVGAMEDAGQNLVLESDKVKAEGISTSIDFEIVGITESEVPVNFNNTCIRPVDEAAVLKLIRASKGQISIPGVKFKAVAKMTVRK